MNDITATPATPAPTDAPITQASSDAVISPAQGDAPASATGPIAASQWPDDWRQKYAAEDAKKLKRLERYASPTAALDALLNAQDKIRSGQLKESLPENATPEQLSAWRADNGIPESADKYEISLNGGYVIGENDKPIVDDFLKAAHEGNFTSAEVNKALDWYFAKQEHATIEAQERIENSRIACEDALRDEFGGDYKRNMAMVSEITAAMPKEVKDSLFNAVRPDGVPVGNDPALIKWLVGLQRELNPHSTVVPGAGTNAVQAIESELSTLRGMMGDRKSAYWRGADAGKLQARYRELTTAMQKGGGR